MKLIHNRSKVAVSVVALSLMIPVSAIAGNVRVSTDNVRATTYSNGNINVSTGKTSVSVPARRRTWYPWRYWRTPWRSSTCRQSAYQQTTQVSNSGGRVTHHSSTTSYCR